MRSILLSIFIVIWTPYIGFAQTYRYINTENGLNNQKIYRIQKDGQGYMWFLSHQGIDRYNGKEIKHYKRPFPYLYSDPQIHSDWIYVDQKGLLWIIGRKGSVFQYDPTHDCFHKAYPLSASPKKMSSPDIGYGYMDRQDRIWLCRNDSITIYHPETGQTFYLSTLTGGNITAVEQADSTHFFIGTERGPLLVELRQGNIRQIPCPAIDNINSPISELYFHAATRKLFIGTFRDGVIVYDTAHPGKAVTSTSLEEENITCITELDKRHVLIATDGQGVYRIHTDSCQAIPYITADYNSYNRVNGNNIYDVYVDNEQRIWLSDYPNGITVRDNRYAHYRWIKHSTGNQQSLINDLVYAVMEDSEGDVWFSTNNGISLYRSQSGTWHSFFSSFQHKQGDKNHLFLTLCEVAPGIIWAGGYSPEIYQINKNSLSTNHFSPSSFSGQQMRPDLYIRSIRKDSEGYIWIGGYSYLKRVDINNHTLRTYPELNSITSIVEKDKKHMWIGTTAGLYLLEKESGNSQLIKLPTESMHIHTLYQAGDSLYIGTSGSGLLVYHFQNHTFSHYHTDNCALMSNNIYVIVAKPDGNILLGTENEIVDFSPSDGLFRNWTKEQGLISTTFNAGAGILRKNRQIILGSNNGAIELPGDIQFPKLHISSPLILSDFRISYQTVYPGDEDSPLKTDINQTQQLKLKHEQNSFSLKVSSINYDYPSDLVFLWKLDGFYDKWTQVPPNGRIRFTRLASGTYTLHIRSVSHEQQYKTYEERSIQITVAPPIWGSTGAILLYITAAVLVTIALYRHIASRRLKHTSTEKTNFFINIAHDIRTPLTMIKAPLEEMIEKKQVEAEGMKNMDAVLRNVKILIHLTTNLINFEKMNTYSSELHVSEFELNSYTSELYQSLLQYACMKNIRFSYQATFSYLNVWFDKDKMDSILKNLISNSLKYTPEGGEIKLTVNEQKDTWDIEIKDTGIGIPAGEQKKLFKSYFRGNNPVNLKISGSGIGLILVYRLVKLHRGKIHFNSVEGEGTCIHLSFPKGKKHFKKIHVLSGTPNEAPTQPSHSNPTVPPEEKYTGRQPNEDKVQRPRILVVEDNDDLRVYLKRTLSDTYRVETCSNGKEALVIVGEFNPSLVLSDVTMSEMGGDELCIAIKENIETSHIPVILLTTQGDEESMLKGLQAGADDYITKPFSVGLLKASISNLLANRDLLRRKYGNLKLDDNLQSLPEGNLSSKDWEFIAAVRKNIEKNIANADFNVDVLCAMHNMSRTSFFNKLKELTGKSPSDHIRSIRLQRASQLLQQGHTPVEVAEMCGFCDVRYFREVFKKHFNENPSQHRKKAE